MLVESPQQSSSCQAKDRLGVGFNEHIDDRGDDTCLYQPIVVVENK